MGKFFAYAVFILQTKSQPVVKILRLRRNADLDIAIAIFPADSFSIHQSQRTKDPTLNTNHQSRIPVCPANLFARQTTFRANSTLSTQNLKLL